MSDQFLGEIRLFANNYAPKGWAFCQGQLLPINQNQALYSLLGNVYGGDGVTTFALPDLRGRVPIHFNSTFPLGTTQGEQNHTLTQNEMPAHTHQVSASATTADQVTPQGNAWASSAAAKPFIAPATLVPMNTAAIGTAGNSQSHPNMQPYLAVNFAIALEGIYPSRN